MRGIDQDVLKLRTSYKSCSCQRGQDALLPYLVGVYELHCRLRRNSKRLTAAKKVLLRFQTSRSRKSQHSMRLIIEATANGANAKAKSRWTRCLRFATRRRVKSKDVLRFIQSWRGISGCAEMFAYRRFRVPKGDWAHRTDPPPPIEHDEDWDPLWDDD